jgi:predicted DNA binding CopG/RHH family protein
MKTSKNKDKRLEIRISEEDLKMLKVAAYCVGLKPSQMIRMFIDTTINAFKIKVNKGEINLEDFQAILND